MKSSSLVISWCIAQWRYKIGSEDMDIRRPLAGAIRATNPVDEDAMQVTVNLLLNMGPTLSSMVPVQTLNWQGVLI